jgi:hypothetical protein
MATASLADALDRRGHVDDVDRAAALRHAAIDAARRFGMTARADVWASAAAHAHVAPIVACRPAGRDWHVSVGECVAAVPDSVGMRYLAHLIDHVGVEIAALDLASGHAVADDTRADAILDADAKLAYRRRINELRADIADADDCADLERATRARLELDRLVEELARVTGLAGRARDFVRDAERARVSVHKAIKRAVATITKIEPTIGREIASHVVTGTRCVFLDRCAPRAARGR